MSYELLEMVVRNNLIQLTIKINKNYKMPL